MQLRYLPLNRRIQQPTRREACFFNTLAFSRKPRGKKESGLLYRESFRRTYLAARRREFVGTKPYLGVTVCWNTVTPPCVPVSVTVPNVTSVTAADHRGFGQEFAGAVGASVVRLNVALPFLST